MAALKLAPGDLFAIPTHNSSGMVGYVACRCIAPAFNGTLLIEVFKAFYAEPFAMGHNISITERLFRPVLFLPVFGNGMIPTKEKWPVIFRNPGYDRAESDYSNIEIGFVAANKIWRNGVSRPAHAARIATLEESILWTPIDLSRRVAGHLAGRLGANEQFDYWKMLGLVKDEVPTDQFKAALWAAGDDACSDSHIMAARFKEWGAMSKLAQKTLPPGKK
jgi:hypothetical protein